MVVACRSARWAVDRAALPRRRVRSATRGIDWAALLEEGRKQYGTAPADDGGGLFGNSIVKGLLKPVTTALDAFDTPRRVIISGLQEGIDALNGGDASW